MAFLFAPAAISVSFPSAEGRVFHPGDVVSGFVHLRVDANSKGKPTMDRVDLLLGGTQRTTFAFRSFLSPAATAQRKVEEEVQRNKGGPVLQTPPQQEKAEVWEEKIELVSPSVFLRFLAAAGVTNITKSLINTSSTPRSRPSGDRRLIHLSALTEPRLPSHSPSFSPRRSSRSHPRSKEEADLMPLSTRLQKWSVNLRPRPTPGKVDERRAWFKGTTSRGCSVSSLLSRQPLLPRLSCNSHIDLCLSPITDYIHVTGRKHGIFSINERTRLPFTFRLVFFFVLLFLQAFP